MMYLLLLIFLAPLILHVATRYSRKGRMLRKIPGLTDYPIFGNLLTFNVKCLNEFWEIARNVTKKYYPLTRFWLCSSAVVSVGHPDDIEILLSSQKVIEKGYIYEYFQPWLKKGLLTSTGDKWRQRRKILTPAFHFSILRKYMDITNEQGQKFIENLKAKNNEITESLVPLCSKYTLNIICESAMGVSLDKMDTKTVDEYKKAVHEMGNIVLYRMPRPYVLNWMVPYLYKIGNLQRNVVKTLHQFTSKIINDRKDFHKRTDNKYLNQFIDEMHGKNGTFSEDTDIGRKKRLAMLDLLLAAQRDGLIDDDGIKEEVDTFTFEGHDTTGMAMTFLLLLLAENKEAQDRARTEVTELLDRTKGKLEIPDIQELNYLERCIKESLRLFPPVPTLLRYTEEDLQLKHALIPAGTHIMIHFFDTHRDPNFWPEPNKFDPDRFLPEFTKDRHPYAYVPFSAGPRNCIGQKFAMLELKSLVARLLYDFYLEPTESTADIKLIADIVLRPFKPAYIKLIKID